MITLLLLASILAPAGPDIISGRTHGVYPDSMKYYYGDREVLGIEFKEPEDGNEEQKWISPEESRPVLKKFVSDLLRTTPLIAKSQDEVVEKVVIVKQADFKKIQGIGFKKGSSKIGKMQRKLIKKAIEDRGDGKAFKITATSDRGGKNESDKKLGSARAEAIKEILMEEGVEEENILISVDMNSSKGNFRKGEIWAR